MKYINYNEKKEKGNFFFERHIKASIMILLILLIFFYKINLIIPIKSATITGIGHT